MSDDLVIRPGVTVWVGGQVQATGQVLEIVDGRRVGSDGPVQVGTVRIKLDGTGDEMDVSTTDIERVL